MAHHHLVSAAAALTRTALPLVYLVDRQLQRQRCTFASITSGLVPPPATVGLHVPGWCPRAACPHSGLSSLVVISSSYGTPSLPKISWWILVPATASFLISHRLPLPDPSSTPPMAPLSPPGESVKLPSVLVLTLSFFLFFWSLSLVPSSALTS